MTKATAKNRIRELRQKLGLSAKNLAERVDTTEATISRIESGKQNLSQTWLQKISQALGVHISTLLDEVPFGGYMAPVIAIVENGKWMQNHFFEKDNIYLLPVVANPEVLGLSAQEASTLYAFESREHSRIILISAKLSKLNAANYIGKNFVVLRTEHDGRSELSLRTLEHRQQGLYFVSMDDDPSQQAVRLDDENVTMVWRVVMEYRIC
jgi:transcriptional regulator with XRE-family HTH domain